MKGWREVKLGEVADFKNGKARPAEKDGAGIPIYGGNGILGYTDAFNYDLETIIIGRVGAYCGSVYYENRPIWISDNALYTVPKDGNDTKYLYYLLKNMDLNSCAEGSSHPLLTQTLLQSLDVVIADSLPEQRAIAGVLSSLDDKIDLLHRQNKTLEALAETMWRKMFVEDADNKLDKVPFERYADFLEGPGIRNWQYTESGTPFINIRLISDGEIDISNANYVSNEEAGSKYKHFMLKEDDMIVSTSGTLGRTAIVRDYHLPLMLNTSVIRFRPRDGKSYSFLYQYLQSNEFQSNLESAATGSVQANFGPMHLKQIMLSIPSDEVMRAYLVKADSLYSKIKINYKQIRALTHLREAILPKLMLGEIQILEEG